jgi:uncharacterized protein HemX
MDMREIEYDELRSQINNLRRGLFARFGELSKEVLNQKLEIELLRSQVNEMRGEQKENWSYNNSERLFYIS